MANYYNVLGVTKGADEKEIRQAFRRLARRYHPDLNAGDEEAETKFKEINEAYEVLSDAETRRKYDAYGDQWKQADQIEAQRRASRSVYDLMGGQSRRPSYADSELFAGIEEIFGDLGEFGRAGRAPAVVRSEAPVTVSLLEAYTGTTVNANLNASGSGRRFQVNIPPGVDNGSTVRISPDRETELLFRVTVTPDPKFRREGSHLFTEAHIPFETAILGGEAQVHTLEGRTIWVRVPEMSQNGQNIRLRGQGMPRLGDPDSKGDLYVTVRPVLPDRLSDEQRDLIERLQELRADGD